MKKSISLIIAFASILIISSCSGAHKGCAAYAKHETNKSETPNSQYQNPTYSDVQ